MRTRKGRRLKGTATAAATTGMDGAEAELVVPAIAEDGTLYQAGKMEVHRLGLRHLAVSVFVFSGDHLLIQRRAAG